MVPATLGTKATRRESVERRDCAVTFEGSTRRTVVMAMAMAPFLTALPALADALDDLRAAGAVGERYDGFLELRDGSNARAKATVKQVNEKRRKIYEKRAKQEGADLAKVGQIYAKQIMAKAPKGTWFLQANGKWAQK